MPLHLISDTASMLGLSPADFAEWQRLNTVIDLAWAQDTAPDLSEREAEQYGTLAEAIEESAAAKNDPLVYAYFPDCQACSHPWGETAECATCTSADGEPLRLWERLAYVLRRHVPDAPHTHPA